MTLAKKSLDKLYSILKILMVLGLRLLCISSLIFLLLIYQSSEIGNRLKEILTVLINESGCQLIAIETQVDHVHIVLKVKPTHQLSKLINSFKGVSARKLFAEFPTIKNRLWKGHMRSPSYFVVTVGSAPLEVIKHYVET